MSKCEVCNENLSKYRCPKCSKKTCSLDCVKKHKAVTFCSGVRDKTEYVKVSNFSDMNFLNDYRFLEEVGRYSDNNHRDPMQRKASQNGYVNQVRKAALKKNIKMKFLPYPMKKRKINSTKLAHYLHGEILWHLELVFPQAEAKYTKRRVNENLIICDILKEFIHPSESDPVKRQKLKSYVQTGIDSCRVFMKVEGQPANDTRFYEMDITKSLNDNLSGKEIIEFPVLYVVMQDKCQPYRLLSEVTDTSQDGRQTELEDQHHRVSPSTSLVSTVATSQDIKQSESENEHGVVSHSLNHKKTLST